MQRKFPRWPVKSIFTNFQRGDFSEQKHFAPHLSGTFMFSLFFYFQFVFSPPLVFFEHEFLVLFKNTGNSSFCAYESERTVICHLNIF